MLIKKINYIYKYFNESGTTTSPVISFDGIDLNIICN